MNFIFLLNSPSHDCVDRRGKRAFAVRDPYLSPMAKAADCCYSNGGGWKKPGEVEEECTSKSTLYKYTVNVCGITIKTKKRGKFQVAEEG